ncbi:MAG: glycosyl hydrolase [Acidobacteria bacterium]|nr:MAG: hypothetical protein AUH13_03340 [Acidobacteria bacterium 13_2_20CM_58_27]PYT82166.1 MAG: glycosyl hydrolase [Acidobacteriota bacterium]
MKTNLRGVSVAHNPSEKRAPSAVVWSSGSHGVIVRSLDEGRSWRRLRVSGGDALDFRGIVAFSASLAYVISSGEGVKSRIYKTSDGGKTWKLEFSDNRKEFFLDAIACRSEKECLALGDPINGKFLLLATTDGEHWNLLPVDNMPAALPGEGAFAASNTSLALAGDKDIFFSTGGPAARVFHSDDGGLIWTVAETPVAHGKASSGIFSIVSDRHNHVLVVGGDYQETRQAERAAAYSLDAGKTWQLAARQPGGFRSALVQVDGGRWIAVGPTGEDSSDDYGVHWKQTGSLDLNALAILDAQKGWAAGPQGTIARFRNP